MIHFSAGNRKKLIEKLKTEHFDLVIVGGGITGAGTARDAASRGMKVALVEACDFASGTSSRSSKLIHGGIRYLENLEFGLVFEALSERRLLFEIAPHLVHPLKFILPVYQDFRAGMFKMSLGMWFYDVLSQFEAPELHQRWNRGDALQEMPILTDQGLKGAFAYYDAYMDDDRLVLETLRSAHRSGATSVNYMKAGALQLQNGKVSGLEVQDQYSNDKFIIKAQHVISSVGPWTDVIGHQWFAKWKDIMRPSKGIHLTLSKKRLPIKDAVVMLSDDEKRIIFAIPRHEMVIIGTTDTDFKGDPATVHTERSDVDYLLKIVGEYFPGANIEEKDILSSYAGVRPLVNDGSETESKTSREHVIFSDPQGITFVAGGKYTTYRNMAEQTVRHALQFFSFEQRQRFRKSYTKTALNPLVTSDTLQKAEMQIPKWAEEFNLETAFVEKLVYRHGMEALDILEDGARSPLSSDPELRFWQLEAQHAIEQTMCTKLTDFILRRTPLFLARSDHGHPIIEALKPIFQFQLGLSDAQLQQDLQLLMQHEKLELGWR